MWICSHLVAPESCSEKLSNVEARVLLCCSWTHMDRAPLRKFFGLAPRPRGYE